MSHYVITVSPTGRVNNAFTQVAPNLRMLDKWLEAYEHNNWTILNWVEV